MRITSTITIEASRITTSVPMSSSPKNRRSRSAISSSSGKRRQILADGLVPDARVRFVGVVVDVSERMDERTQGKLEVECPGGARDAAEGMRLGHRVQAGGEEHKHNNRAGHRRRSLTHY